MGQISWCILPMKSIFDPPLRWGVDFKIVYPPDLNFFRNEGIENLQGNGNLKFSQRRDVASLSLVVLACWWTPNSETLKPKTHLILIGFTTFLAMSLVEYLGWLIYEKISSNSAESGFFSIPGLMGILENCIGALVFALICIGLACIIPSFRANWKAYIHRPAWVGVLFFSIALLSATLWGYFSTWYKWPERASIQLSIDFIPSRT